MNTPAKRIHFSFDDHTSPPAAYAVPRHSRPHVLITPLSGTSPSSSSLPIKQSSRSTTMPPPPSSPIPLNKRALSTILGALFIIFLLSLTFSRTTTTAPTSPPTILASTSAAPINHITVSNEILKGSTIASGKIENATAKAELGRASWHTFHTIMAKFPDRPSGEEQTALASYIHLWARLYPCSECASHFRTILTKYPPQVSTRSTAAAWACHVHNEVNRSLDKEEFDCSKIGEFYDCGCADDDDVGGKGKGKGEEGGGRISLVVEKNGPTRGG